ncbi:alpha/beta hydrolase family esterase [Marinicella litoralis]|uniref:alpha/beta hydrolase family esterase n=1 Tax=Marinicella litoralis TaxID=644220 RepID=UPI00105D6D70|nr:hypothetical protein [Marinicella litoralis]
MRLNNYYAWLLFVLSTQALATASVPSLNQCTDMIFIDGLENASLPSNGSGGVFPGNTQRMVFGGYVYYIYIPSSYDPNVAMPVMYLWHGAAGAGNADNQAQAVRSLWDGAAESNGFIIVSQVGTSPNGSWSLPNDKILLTAIMQDMEASYRIETTRIYLWGFSAGGHVMHDTALDDANRYAAYAVSAGVLAGFAAGQGHVPANADRTIPVFVSVGNSDQLLSYAEDDRMAFLQAGWVENKNYWLDVFVGAHQVPSSVPAEIWEKICISTNLD